MSRLASEYLPGLRRGRGWGRAPVVTRPGPSPVLAVAGLAIVVAGVAACYVLAPDVQRYLKMRNM